MVAKIPAELGPAATTDIFEGGSASDDGVLVHLDAMVDSNSSAKTTLGGGFAKVANQDALEEGNVHFL